MGPSKTLRSAALQDARKSHRPKPATVDTNLPLDRSRDLTKRKTQLRAAPNRLLEFVLRSQHANLRPKSTQAWHCLLKSGRKTAQHFATDQLRLIIETEPQLSARTQVVRAYLWAFARAHYVRADTCAKHFRRATGGRMGKRSHGAHWSSCELRVCAKGRKQSKSHWQSL